MPCHSRVPLLLALFTLPLFCQTQTIDFEQFSGSDRFSAAQPPLTILSATFSGGQILRNATFASADRTTVYGSAYFCAGCSPTITIDFATKVSNFSVFVLNGDPFTVSYTVVDDQQGQQTVSLVSHDLSGATTITLPESGITHVAISPSDPSLANWDFVIDNVRFTPAASTIVDPVPALMRGPSVTTDTFLLATQGTIVKNVAADGVTQVVVRVLATSVGEQLNLVLYNDHNVQSTTQSQDGALALIGGTPSQSAVTVTAVATPSGPMAFALYQAPLDFARDSSDSLASLRSEYVHVQSLTNPSFTAIVQITIVRPPVVLVHGLWGDATGWNNFNPLISDGRFFIRRADFSGPLSGITNASPPTDPDTTASARQNSLGLAANSPIVLGQINQFINDFKTSNSAAAVQADIVGHSMGGVITRNLRTLPSFASSINFGKGPVHKLITIGTPHLGSPLATALLQGANDCTRFVMARGGSISFANVTLPSGIVTGGVGDLQGDGTGGGLSAALTNLQSASSIGFPAAFIAGIMSQNNLAGLSCVLCAAEFIRDYCNQDPLGTAFTPTGWPFITGQNSDGIVPLTSQLNNTQPTSPGMEVQGVVHSTGMPSLGFNGPAELDQVPGLTAIQVILLLNEFITGTDFRPL